MKQSLIGLGLALVGLLIARFNEPLARISSSMNRWTGSLDLPVKWARWFNLLAGVLWLVYGLLVVFHLAPLPWEMGNL